MFTKRFSVFIYLCIFLTIFCSCSFPTDNQEPRVTSAKVFPTSAHTTEPQANAPTAVPTAPPPTLPSETLPVSTELYLISVSPTIEEDMECVIEILPDNTFLLSLNFFEGFFDVTGTYTLSGDVMTFTVNNYQGLSTFTIEKATQSRYILYYSSDALFGIIESGMPFSVITKEKFDEQRTIHAQWNENYADIDF